MNLHDFFTFHLVQDRIREINKYAKVVPSVKGRVKVGGACFTTFNLVQPFKSKDLDWHIGLSQCFGASFLTLFAPFHLPDGGALQYQSP